MNSENNETNDQELIPIAYEDNVLLQACFEAGFCSFDKQYLIKVLEISELEIRKQFEAEDGNYYNAWAKGFYSIQTLIRKTVIESALNSSTPSIEKMLAYFAEVENDLNN